jgi:ribosome assembly protein YihI (activator of Der GTPase)
MSNINGKSSATTDRPIQDLEGMENDVTTLATLISSLNDTKLSEHRQNDGVGSDTSRQNEKNGAIEDGDEGLEELLRRLEEAHSLADGVEDRVDALLSNLEELLGQFGPSEESTPSKQGGVDQKGKSHNGSLSHDRISNYCNPLGNSSST